MLPALLKVIEEQSFSSLKVQRTRKRLEKARRQGRLHVNPGATQEQREDWAYRLCAARLMMSQYDWHGWELRSGWSWRLANEDWQFPRWDGTPGRLLVLAEQGLGDEILFLSCAEDLRRDNPDITWEVDNRLLPICRRSFPEIRFVSRWKDDEKRIALELEDRRPEEYDAYIPSGAVPKLYRRRREDFPGAAWLKPDPEAVERWRGRVGGRYGISWQGGVGNEHYLPPAALCEAGRPINLQYNASWEGADDVECRDFDDHLAMIAALDHVNSVPTALVHICGAIGQKVDVIRPPRNDAGAGTHLRFMFNQWNGRSDWYGPHMQLFPNLKAWEATMKKRKKGGKGC